MRVCKKWKCAVIIKEKNNVVVWFKILNNYRKICMPNFKIIEKYKNRHTPCTSFFLYAVSVQDDGGGGIKWKIKNKENFCNEIIDWSESETEMTI